MFRGKENRKNHPIKRSLAFLLSLVLLLTGINFDGLRVRAAYGDNVSTVLSGTTIGQIYTASGIRKVDYVSFSATGNPGATISATLNAVYKDVEYAPIGSVNLVAGNASDSKIINFEGDVAQFSFDITSANITLAGGETLGVQITLTCDDGQISVLTDPSGTGKGFYSANPGDTTSYYNEDDMIVVSTSQGSGDLLEKLTPTLNIPGNDIYLSQGQSFQLAASIGSSYYRSVEYSLTDGEGVVSLDRLSGQISANAEGEATITVGGEGVEPTPVNVHVIKVDAKNQVYPYSGTSVIPTLEITQNGANYSAADASKFVVENPATNVGGHSITITGGSDYPVFSSTGSYEISAIDISTIPIENQIFTIDTDDNIVTGGTFEFAGNTYSLDTDFSATAEYKTRSVNTAVVPFEVTYTYDVTITGKNNFFGTKTFDDYTFTSTANTMTISQVYDVALGKTEIIWDGNGEPQKPTLSFTNKITNQKLPGFPSDIHDSNITWNIPAGSIGQASVEITSDIYGGDPIVLNYIIKRKIDNSSVDVVLDKPSYVFNTGETYQPVPTVTLKGAVDPIDPSQYDVAYSNNDKVGNDATVTITAKRDSFYSGTVTANFSIFQNLHSSGTKVSIGGAHNSSEYATTENDFHTTSFVGTYTGSVVKVPLSTPIEIIVDGNVLDHNLYYVDDAGYGVKAEDESTPLRPIDGISAGLGTGSVLIRTTPAYGSQSLRVYYTIIPRPVADVQIVATGDGAAAFSAARTYTGSAIELDKKEGFGTAFNFKVTDNLGNELKAEDYTVSYEDNINAGEASLIVEGQGNYTGRKKTTFNILPYNINGDRVSIDEIGDQSYKGNLQEVQPDINLYFDGNPVDKTAGGFKVEYSNNSAISTSTSRAVAKITGIGNFTGSRTVNFNIVPKSITNASLKFTIGTWTVYGNGTDARLESGEIMDYNGGRQVPDLIIEDNRARLIQGRDYNIRPVNNINVHGGSGDGAPAIIITGIGNYGSSSNNQMTITFGIKHRDITNPRINVALDLTNPETNGPQGKVTVEDPDNVDHKILKEGKDYELEYKTEDGQVWDLQSGGNLTLHVKGINNYIGDATRVFTIGNSLADQTNVHIGTYFPLEGTAQDKIAATVTGNGTLRPGYIGNTRPKFFITDGNGTSTSLNVVASEESGDIEVEYNKISGVDGYTAGDVVEAVITGKGGDYFGTRRIRYQITPTRFTWPLSGSMTDYNYRDNYDITINGQKVKKETIGTTDYYYVEFTYTGENTIDVNASVELMPENKNPDVYGEFPDSIPVDVSISGKIDLSKEVTSINALSSNYITLSPVGSSATNFTGNRRIYYKVSKTSIGNSEKNPADGVSVTGVSTYYTYKGSKYDKNDFNIEVKYGSTVLEENNDYTIEYGSATYDNTNVAKGGIVIIKGTGYYSGTIEKKFEIRPKVITAPMVKLSGFDVPASNRFNYDGSDKVPSVTVTDGSKTLVAGEDNDYVVTLPTDKVNPSLSKQIIVEGKNNYTGTVSSLTYRVIANIESSDFTVTGFDSTGYDMDGAGKITGRGDNSLILPDSVKLNHTALTPVLNTDYKVTSSKNIASPVLNTSISVTGQGAYEGTKIVGTASIYGDVKDATISGVDENYRYTGQNITPEPVIVYRGTRLSKDTDYTVSYDANKEVGVGKVIITGKGAFVHSIAPVEKTFNIGYDLGDAIITGYNSSYEYTGAPITINPTITVNGKKLSLDDNYTLEYRNNEKVGTATVTIKSGNNTFSERSFTFEIRQKGATNIQVNLEKSSYEYEGKEIQPFITSVVAEGKTVPPSDYTVSYDKNINVGTGYVKVTLNGNFTGNGQASFTITKRDLSSDGITASVENIIYSGNKVTPPFVIKDGDNNLIENKDFTVKVSETVNVTSYAFIEFTGMGNYQGSKQINFSILPLDLNRANINLASASHVYTGEALTRQTIRDNLEITIVDGAGRDIPINPIDINFTFGGPNVESDGSIIKVGTYTMNIVPGSLTSNITGSAQGTYEIYKKEIKEEGFSIFPDEIKNTDLNYDTYYDSDAGQVYINGLRLTDTSFGNLGTASKELTYGTDYEVEYTGNDRANEKASVTLNGIGNYSGSITRYFSIGTSIAGAAGAKINLQGAPASTKIVYDGQPHQVPIDYVLFGLDDSGNPKRLEKGKDYIEVQPENAINVGKHQIIARGSGKYYYGDAYTEFEITKRNAAASQFETNPVGLTDGYWIYNGTPAKPEIEVYDMGLGGLRVDPSQYTVSYNNNTGIGTANYVVTFTPSSNYNTSTKLNGTFEILAKDMSDDEIDIRFSPSYTYSAFDGQKKTPPVSVYNYDTMIPDSNYTVEYSNNINPGIGKVTVTMKNNYSGIFEKTFQIKASLTSQTVTSVTAANRRFTGSEIDGKGIKVVVNTIPTPTVLTEGVDYQVNITPVGGDWSAATRATAVITPIDDEKYTGSRTVNFNIIKDIPQGQDPGDPGYVDPNPQPEIEPNPEGYTISGISDTYSYRGTAIKPVPTVKYQEVEQSVNNVIYTSADNNACVQPGIVNMTIVVGGSGGNRTLTYSYKIVKGINDSTITAYLTPNSYNYTAGNKYEPGVNIVDNGTNRSLVNGVDYTVTYDSNTTPGTAMARITGIGLYTGTKSLPFTIVDQLAITGLSAKATSSTSVQLGWVAKSSGVTSYTITYSGGSTGTLTAAGTAGGVVVTGLNPGKTYTFTVVANNGGKSGSPSLATATTPTSGSNGGGVAPSPSNPTSVAGLKVTSSTSKTAVLTWTIAGDGTRYKVYRSSDGTNYKHVATIPMNSGTFTDSAAYGLTSGKYYYKVRPFVMVNGQVVYGNYTDAVSVTVK